LKINSFKLIFNGKVVDMKRITLIKGDGIGPEVVKATVKVVEATGVQIKWEEVDAGESAINEYGTVLPQNVIDSIKKNKVALKGPVGTPIGDGFRSVSVSLRKKLNLYANLRPIKSLPGVKSMYKKYRHCCCQRKHRGSLFRHRA